MKSVRKIPIQYTNTYIWNLEDGNDNPICKTEKETQMYRTDFWTLGEGEGGMFRKNNMYIIYSETDHQPRWDA